jgi:hypothetical protein
LTGAKNPHYGKQIPVSVRRKISQSSIGKSVTDATRKKLSMHNMGIKNELDWPGFSALGQYCEKWVDPRLKIRKRVRAYQGDKCIICGKTANELGYHGIVHHVGKNKDACCNTDKSTWLFVVVCKKHHTHDEESKQTFKEIIALQYGGKCMYTLDGYNKLYPHGSNSDKQWGRSNGK